jgi:hypothetical protein
MKTLYHKTLNPNLMTLSITRGATPCYLTVTKRALISFGDEEDIRRVSFKTNFFTVGKILFYH